MLAPLLGDVGIGFYTDDTTVVTAIEVGTNRAARDDLAAQSAVVTYPGPGVGPEAPAFGHELPSPLLNCPRCREGAAGSGLLYIAPSIDGAALRAATASLRRNASPVDVCVITAETDVNKSYLADDQAILIPAEPLAPDGSYEVGLDWRLARSDHPRHAEWKFTS